MHRIISSCVIMCLSTLIISDKIVLCIIRLSSKEGPWKFLHEDAYKWQVGGKIFILTDAISLSIMILQWSTLCMYCNAIVSLAYEPKIVRHLKSLIGENDIDIRLQKTPLEQLKPFWPISFPLSKLLFKYTLSWICSILAHYMSHRGRA